MCFDLELMSAFRLHVEHAAATVLNKRGSRSHAQTNAALAQTRQPAADYVKFAAPISLDHANIARLAYLYWLERGCPIGSPEEDWFQAEQDLKNEQTRAA